MGKYKSATEQAMDKLKKDNPGLFPAVKKRTKTSKPPKPPKATKPPKPSKPSKPPKVTKKRIVKKQRK